MPIQLIEKEEISKPSIPSEFIYEGIDGKPIFYKGYKEALAKKLHVETIIGASEIQSHKVYFHNVCFIGTKRSRRINERGIVCV
jgi:hypothetical protein